MGYLSYGNSEIEIRDTTFLGKPNRGVGISFRNAGSDPKALVTVTKSGVSLVGVVVADPYYFTWRGFLGYKTGILIRRFRRMLRWN